MRKRSEIGTAAAGATPKEERTPMEKVAKPAAPPAPPREPGVRSNAELAMGGGFDQIVKTVFEMPDPDALFEELQTQLTLAAQPSRASYAQLVDSLDIVEKNAFQAVRLLANAKLALASFEIDATVTLGALRTQATEALQAEKAQGTRSKAITEADVELSMAEMFPDEYRDISVRKEKAKRTVEVLEKFSELYKQRCRTLEIITQGARGA